MNYKPSLKMLVDYHCTRPVFSQVSGRKNTTSDANHPAKHHKYSVKLLHQHFVNSSWRDWRLVRFGYDNSFRIFCLVVTMICQMPVWLDIILSSSLEEKFKQKIISYLLLSDQLPMLGTKAGREAVRCHEASRQVARLDQ